MSKVIILTGPGGSGKTTIAKLIADKYGYYYLDGDNEDTEFFPDGDQWLPENTNKLRQAHENIFKKTKLMVEQGKGVIVDYIIFGRYKEFIGMFREKFGLNLEVFVLFPSEAETINRDNDRECWTTGEDRIRAVRNEFVELKKDLDGLNFLDTTDQNPEETFDKYFGKFKVPA